MSKLLWLVTTPFKVMLALFYGVLSLAPRYQRHRVTQVAKSQRRFILQSTSDETVIFTTAGFERFSASSDVATGQRNATPFRKRLEWRRYLPKIQVAEIRAYSGSNTYVLGFPVKAEKWRELVNIDNILEASEEELARVPQSGHFALASHLCWVSHLANLDIAKRHGRYYLPKISPVTAAVEKPMKDVTPKLVIKRLPPPKGW